MFRPIISVPELLRLIQHGDPGPQENVLVVDCRFSLADPGQGRREYETDHVPGAVYAHLDDDLSGPIIPGVTGRHPLPDPASLAVTLSRLGISPKTAVVAYDSGPGAFAARLWWLLRWVGHPRVAVLDGGYGAWKASGVTEGAPRRPAAATSLPYPIRVDPDMTVSVSDVQNRLKDDSWRLIDAREHERWLGRAEPIDPVAGRIPRAVSAPWQENLGADGRFKSPLEIKARFEPLLKNVAVDHTVVYCGSGVTAAHDLLALDLAGLPGAKLYPGSWSEWITDPARPVERG